MHADAAVEYIGDVEPCGQAFACPRTSHHELFWHGLQLLSPTKHWASLNAILWPCGHVFTQLYVEFTQLWISVPFAHVDEAVSGPFVTPVVGAGVVVLWLVVLWVVSGIGVVAVSLWLVVLWVVSGIGVVAVSLWLGASSGIVPFGPEMLVVAIV